MNIVNSGNNFTIYGEEVQTYKQLPAKTYKVSFTPMSGFSLKLHDDINTTEKVYGDSVRKVEKTLATFAAFDRNMGIILSGPKGAGKSLFARLLAERGRERNLPMIIVDTAYNDLSSFLSLIKQECIILFDEFEKTFDDEEGEQDKLLSLFDGIDTGKKLFVLTCNETRFLSEYFLNRPGRFHYHFEFGAPTSEDISEYLEDNLTADAKLAIPDILRASWASEFTYDILRAITFELNQGYSLSETLEDLNIEQTTRMWMHMNLEFSNGVKAFIEDDTYPVDFDDRKARPECIFDINTLPEEVRHISMGDISLYPTFNPQDIDFGGDQITLAPSAVSFSFYNGISDADVHEYVDTWISELELTKVTFTRAHSSGRKKLNIRAANMCKAESI